MGSTNIVGVVARRLAGSDEFAYRCEDSSAVQFFDGGARMSLLRIERTYVQDLTVCKAHGSDWKVADVSSQRVVKSFEGQPCAA